MKATGTIGSILVALAMLVAVCVPPAWGAVTGVVSGTVTDQETGEALTGANISLEGTGLRTVTGERGRFVITNVPPGTYSLRVDLIGYTPTIVAGVVVVQDRIRALEIALEPTVVEAVGAEATVTAPRVSLQRDLSAPVYVVTAADEQLTLSQPNDRYQFPGLVFAQPGAVPDATFYPHIRGARANQVGYFLDGIPITEPNTNVFATNIVSIGLDRLEFYPGGYPAQYGGFTGGIVNQVVKRGDQMRGRFLDVSMGAPYDMAQLILESGEVSDRYNWYWGVNGWRSDFNNNLFTSSAPAVWDAMVKVIYDAGQQDDMTLLAHHGYARYELPFDRLFAFDPTIPDWMLAEPGPDFARQGHDVDALTLNHTISPQSHWTLRLSRVSHFLKLDLGDLDNMYWQNRNERMQTGQFDYEAQVGDHLLRSGVWYTDSNNNCQYSVYLLPVNFITNNDTANTQAYLEDIWEVNRRLILTLGARYDRMEYDRTMGGDLTLDEATTRGGLTYVLSPRLLFRGNYGSVAEFPRANLIGYKFTGLDAGWYQMLAPEFAVKPQIDRTWDLGLEYIPDDSTLVSATYFDRDSRQMMQRWQGVLHDSAGGWVVDGAGNPILSDRLEDFDPFAPVWFASNGSGTSKGVELKIDHRRTKNFRGWLAYTYLDATATSPRDNVYPLGFGFFDQTDPDSLSQEFRLPWDQRHTAALVGMYRSGKLLINPWVQYGSGFPYGQSGLDAGGSDPAHVPNPNYDPGDPGSPAELLVPENLLDPANPAGGFVSPDDLITDHNFTLNLNLWYDIGNDREAYLQIYNILGRDDVTSMVIYHPQTGAVIGRIEGDSVYYVPFSTTPPRFFALGIRQSF